MMIVNNASSHNVGNNAEGNSKTKLSNNNNSAE
jgi:hypothetical protein